MHSSDDAYEDNRTVMREIKYLYPIESLQDLLRIKGCVFLAFL